MPGWGYTSPPGWATTIRHVMSDHGGICHVCGKGGADRIDHVIPVAEGGSHNLANLRPIHQEPCHREKTRQEIARGNRRKPSVRRKTEPHPGML